LTNAKVIQTFAAVEEVMKKAEPMIDMIFLETASLNDTEFKETKTNTLVRKVKTFLVFNLHFN
jgi:hypothetical protein